MILTFSLSFLLVKYCKNVKNWLGGFTHSFLMDDVRDDEQQHPISSLVMVLLVLSGGSNY